ncbi:MAG: transporter substrate-binding domain-containing protein, partial [Eubacteriales bacterium]|nr:transporter substrate-binding domain-containing protein [Eubacteriales bacterium]
MKIRKTLGRFVGFALALCLLLGVCAPGFAAQSVRVIRIGYIDYEGFVSQQADGSYAGYGVDLLTEISKYTEWKYEFVFDTWTNQMEAVKRGDIDFICHAQKTPEREENYLFSRYSVGTEASIMYVRADDDRYYYNDFENLNGIRVALLQGSYQNSGFAAYAAQKGFTYTPIYFQSDSEAFAALDEGRVEATVMGSLASKNGYKIVCRVGSDPFYFITGLGNQALVDELDDALSEILSTRPYYLADLYRSHYASADAAQSLNLTRDETAYIQQQTEPVAVGQLRNRYPMSDYNDQTGELTGINEDVLAKLGSLTGLAFSGAPLDENETTVAALGSGRFQLIMGVVENDAFRQNPDLVLSDPYLESTLAIVAPKGLDFDPEKPYRVAMKKAFLVLQNYIAANYSQYDVQFYTTDDECLSALMHGEADIMMQNVYVTNYLMQKPQYASLEILPTTFLTERSCFMASSAEDPRLLSILNKAIPMLTGEDLDRIVLANTSAKPYQLTTGDLLYKYRVPLSFIGLLLAACIALFVSMTASRHRHYRDIQLKNTQLAEAVAQAERASTAKSQFLSRMSHEIRTPMNAIVGLTTLARRCEDQPAKMEEYLAKIDVSSKVLLNIINDVLDMSAIESAKLKIASSEFDLTQVLANISTIYYPQCKSKGIDFVMVTDITDETVVGDSLRVSQVLLNLVSNAYKFTSSGGRIEVAASQTDRRDGKVFIRFKVSDTGTGMSDEMMSRLFKPFEQETALTAQKHGGSGLGLSIAKNLVDMMHGAITVESKVGEGTCFTVDIPFQSTGRESRIDPEKLAHLKALIVDDDTDARLYTAVVMDRIGIHYDVACSGEEAASMLERQHEKGLGYDICFVDWKMKGMNGIDLTRRVRELFDRKTMVIIVSAYDLSEVEDEARGAGADLFIPKPLFQSTVFNVLVQLTGGVVKQTEKEPEQYDFTGRRVLLAEDNPTNTLVATELLSLVNLEAAHAENGKEAVDMFLASKPGEYDLILMDIQMPEMDGYEATRAIRS